jgi:CheY-like chemotaxis protein
MKILIAEDEPKTLLTLRLALEDRAHEVIATTNGEECINVYRSEFFACARQQQRVSSDVDGAAKPFDIVVLDYRMPKKNGTEVAEEILKLNPDERIIFASAYTPTVLQALSTHSGDNKKRVEWLQKPFELNLLTDMMEDLPKLQETPATLS